MAGDAGPGHRLVAAAVEIDKYGALKGARLEVVELRKRGATVRTGAEFDGVDANNPLRVAGDRGIEVERGIGIHPVGFDEIVLDKKCQCAVGVAAGIHAAAVAKILLVAEHDGDLGARAGVKTIGGFPLRQRVPRVGRIDGGVVGLLVGGTIRLHAAVGLNLRIGEKQEVVRSADRDGCGIGSRGEVGAAAATATARGQQ